PSGPDYTRKRVTDIIRANRKIVTPKAVEDLTSVEIGGITQWLSIRGADSGNPVLLYVHGGPGSPTMPAAWTFQRPWEDFFTVVQWDQRGTGKTYAANDVTSLDGTMNLDQFVSDAEQVVRYLMHRFNQQRVFVLGHSWGSMVGLELAQRHPQMLHAYIGCGQIINSSRSEADGWDFALRSAREAKNEKAIRELEALAPYPGPIGTLTVERISTQRNWLNYYGGLTYGRSDFAYDADTWALSPDYTDRDVALVDKGSLYSLTHLLGAVERANFDGVTQLRCPVFMYVGRHDYATSHNVTSLWFERVQAPHKKLVWFEDSSHMMMIEQPGIFLQHLIGEVRPLAKMKPPPAV
ncbi:MAG: alpha/beta fold hydrolase, partial [Candidatus Eremiobacteraeota bacterium]|nr:alpha/beta fold hydrolase [Candidatus Eremiobacteraeota bacterium]